MDYAQIEFGLNYKNADSCVHMGNMTTSHPIHSHMIPVIRKIHEASKLMDPLKFGGTGEERS